MDSTLSLPFATERLLLRDWVEDDWPAMLEYASDPEVVRYLFWGPHLDKEPCLDFIRRQIASQAQRPRRAYELAVVSKSDGKVIGGIGLRVHSAEDREGDIGYGFNRLVWGQGYATEAAGALIEAGFHQLGLHRIYATCDPRNLGSARVLEKTGMQREGHLRQHKRFKGTWRDSLLYAVLEDE